MNIHSQSHSATIYQFPVGGRAGLDARHETVGHQTVRHGEMPTAGSLALTDAWYHQVAIQQDVVIPTGKQ